jgi:uncharacterized protein (TIGR03083 family)
VAAPLNTATDLDFVELFAVAAERFAIAVAARDMRASVPSCRGWTTYDLIVHLGNVHAWAATIVETGRSAAEQNDEPRSRKPRAVSEWYAGKAEDLYQVLRCSDLTAKCWTLLATEGTGVFWARRQLHETAMHQVDLDQAAGHDPLSDQVPHPDVSSDGVDEVLTVFVPRTHRRGNPVVLSAPLCLEATDTGRAWTLTPRPAPPTSVPAQSRGAAPAPDGPPLVVDRRHPMADRIEAPAGVLHQLLWKRLSLDAPEVAVSGEPSRVQAFLDSKLTP